MITEYFVCYARNSKELQEAVNKAIGNGWQPFGGVAAVISIKWLGDVPGERLELLYQAVVRMTHDPT